MKINKLGLFLAFLYLSFASHAQKIWNIDTAASKIDFTIGGPLGTTVDGSFSSPKGTIFFNASNLQESNFDIYIPVASLNTGNSKRDSHLKKKEYFDAVIYPAILFKSSKIEKNVSGYTLTGTLTLKKIRKLIQIPFTMHQQNGKTIFKGTIPINRLDYGVGTSSYLMKDLATVSIEVVASP